MKTHMLLISTWAVVLTGAASPSADMISLSEASVDLKVLPASEVLIYDISAIAGSEDPIDYGKLILETTLADDVIILVDTISTSHSLPRSGGVTFRRELRFPANDLLRPLSITLDIISGTNSVREMTWSNGLMHIHGKGEETFSFDRGILTFNALLRIARCLSASAPIQFTVDQYAEPILFRVRDSKQPDDAVLTIHDDSEPMEAKVEQPDVTFRLLSAKIHTEIWLNSVSVPTKIIEHIPGDSRLVYSLIKKDVPTYPSRNAASSPRL